MARLSVNINKVALIRNSREGKIPDLIKVAKDCEAFGAQGITVHPRPDERHIRYADIGPLKEIVTTEFNIEGNPTKPFMDLVCKHRPDQCTLVPDPPGVLTSDTGWDTINHAELLSRICDRLHQNGIRVSLFIDADPVMVQGAKEVGADRVEFYTGKFAHDFEIDPELAVKNHIDAAITANALGVGINAGHDLNPSNLRYYKTQVPNLLEVSIGHALICDALYFGLQNVIQMYLHLLR